MLGVKRHHVSSHHCGLFQKMDFAISVSVNFFKETLASVPLCCGSEHTVTVVAFMLSFCRHFIPEQRRSTRMQLIDSRLMKRCVAALTSKVRHNISSARFYTEQVAASPGLRLCLCKYRGKGGMGVYE